MSGVAAIITRPGEAIITDLILALHFQNFSGDVGCGIVVSDGKGRINSKNGRGPVANGLSDIKIDGFPGSIGIGFNSDKKSYDKPLSIKKDGEWIFLVIDAASETVKKIHDMVEQEASFTKAIKTAMLTITEPFALVGLYQKNIIAARNSGLKPLCYGEFWQRNNGWDKSRGYYIASQSGVVDNASRFIGSVNPGEMIVFTANTAKRKLLIAKSETRRCVQQALFIQRPGNLIGRKEVSSIRRSIGRALGEKFIQTVCKRRGRFPFKSSVAVQAPIGGTFYLAGFGEVVNIPCNQGGIIKNHYPMPMVKPPPSVIMPINKNVIEAVVRGMVVVMVTDEIRSGNEIKVLAQQCRIFGAREVHIVAATLTNTSCPYGNCSYTFLGEHKKRTARDLGVDSLTSLDTDELIRAIDTPGQSYCTYCLNFK